MRKGGKNLHTTAEGGGRVQGDHQGTEDFRRKGALFFDENIERSRENWLCNTMRCKCGIKGDKTTLTVQKLEDAIEIGRKG